MTDPFSRCATQTAHAIHHVMIDEQPHYPLMQRVAAFLITPAVAWCWLVWLLTGYTTDLSVRQKTPR